MLPKMGQQAALLGESFGAGRPSNGTSTCLATMLASGLRNLNRYKTIWKQHPVPTIAKTTRQKIDSVQNEINGKVGKRELHCSKEGEKSLEPFHLHLFIPSSKSEVSGKNKYCPVWDELIWEEEMNVWHLLLPWTSPVDLFMCSV